MGQLCRSVASVAKQYGVSQDTTWTAARWHGTPLADDHDHVDEVRALGVDEHSYLAANRLHSTIYATVLGDLDRRQVIDLFEGKTAEKLRNRTQGVPRPTRARVRSWSWISDTYRLGLSPHLAHGLKVADPFHVTRIANCMLGEVRRRVQNEALGNRGRKDNPLFLIRKLLLKGEERLDDRAGTSCSPA